jgi:hypothetical protein
MAQGAGDNTWYRLTPDSSGHYVNGTWTARASSTWSHIDGSTAVLPSGKVFVAGGENGNSYDTVEIYDPVADSWSVAVNPAYFGNIEDGNAMVLPGGQVLIEPQEASSGYSGDTFLFNPADNTFSQTAGAPLHGITESTWVKLPGNYVLTIDSDNSSSGATTAEYYDPSTSKWQDLTANGVPNIWPDLSGSGVVSEMGPAFLLPNRSAIFFGGNGVTAVFSPLSLWSQGATLGGGLGMKDAPGAMMVNGKILLAVSPPGDNSSKSDVNGIGPTSFYEFDYTANNGVGSFTIVPTPLFNITIAASPVRFLDLPDGTVLMTANSTQPWVYQPDGTPLTSGQPTIESVSKNSDGSLHLVGTLFNGISQGASYGDDAQMDSNYPLARFTDASGHVRYGRSYNWSSTSVMTGSALVSTECTLPAGASLQDTIQVVANGNASAGVHYPLFGGATTWVDYSFSYPVYDGTQAHPFNTLHSAFFTGFMGTGVLTVQPGGILAIAGDQNTSGGDGIITITTPVRITAWPGTGTAHIGPN